MIVFVQRVSIASYAERCISYYGFSQSVCLSVHPSQSGMRSKCLKLRSYGLHWRITHDSNFLMVGFTAKFQSEHRERGAE